VEVLLGAISSLLYGVADFIGGEGARKVTAATFVLWAAVFSFPLLVVISIIVGGTAGNSDYIFGTLAGMSGAVGLVLLFAGLAVGRAAVVAPTAAAIGAVIPVVAGIIGGDRPSPLAWFGVALAIPAIVLSAWAADEEGSEPNGFAYGFSAGIGFGGFAILIGMTADGSGLFPLAAARGAMILVIFGISLAGAWQIQRLSEAPIRLVLSNSIMDVTANIALLLALRAGSFSLGVVAASFYPAVTVALARVVNHEALRRRQIAGIALTLVALAFIALG
jgi:drug/metabolite transporter (DMT)-like permease